MGNSFRKIDLQGTIVDGGSLQSKDTASRPSQTTTQRDPNEADPKVVGKLINAKKLAPFYEGQFDEKPDGASNVDRQSRLSSRNSRHDSSHQDAVATSPNSRGKKKPSISSSGGGSKKKSQAPPIVDNKWLTTGLIECPICFLVTLNAPLCISTSKSFVVVPKEY